MNQGISKKRNNCIDEMNTLLDQINEFKKLVETTENKYGPEFKQEYKLFKQHVEWAIEDLGTKNYIANTKIKSKAS